MRYPVDQISQDDVIVRQQQMDRERRIEDLRPASFSEYLQMMDDRPSDREPAESLAELAVRAKRAPRDG